MANNLHEDESVAVVFAPVLNCKWFRKLDLLSTLSLFHLLLLRLPLVLLVLLPSHHRIVLRSESFVRDRQVEQTLRIAVHPLAVNLDKFDNYAIVFFLKNHFFFANLLANNDLRWVVGNDIFIFVGHPGVIQTNECIFWFGFVSGLFFLGIASTDLFIL